MPAPALDAEQAAAPVRAEAPAAPIIVTPSGLRFQVLQAGIGRRPTLDDAVQVSYQGRLADGTVFDSTEAPVGILVRETIPGFTEALLMMNQGGRYRFWVPPGLAYGAEGSRGIVPPGAELDFTLTLIAVGRPARPPSRR
jgi:FKBP-type peptidyl-prolyl cis-trans isomerase FkpA